MKAKTLNQVIGFNIIVGVVTVVLMVLVLSHLNDKERARVESAHDSCNLIVGLVRSGETDATHAKVEAYIKSTVLHDCGLYANHVIYAPNTSNKNTTTSPKRKKRK